VAHGEGHAADGALHGGDFGFSAHRRIGPLSSLVSLADGGGGAAIKRAAGVDAPPSFTPCHLVAEAGPRRPSRSAARDAGAAHSCRVSNTLRHSAHGP